MISLFGILLYPVVFLVLYAACEAVFPTRNSAMIISLFAAFPVCLLYVRLRTGAKERADKKKSVQQSRQDRLARLMLLRRETFEKLFPDCLCDQSVAGVTEEKLLEYLRKYGCEHPVEIVSLSGVTPGAKALADLLRVPLNCMDEQEVFLRTQHTDLPDLPPLKMRQKFARFKTFMVSSQARRFCLRYSLLLFFLSILTPFRLYYWLFGFVLLGLFGFSVYKSRLNRRNQILSLRSE